MDGEPILDQTPKRFKLSDQEFAKERMGVTKQEVKALQQEHPEVLSLCLFGSMVTGRARPESDIDGYLFVDADVVSQGTQEEKTETEYYPESKTPNTTFKSEAAEKYLSPLRKSLKEKLGLSDEQLKHVRIRPISEEIIEQHIESIAEQIENLERYPKIQEEYEARSPLKKSDATDEEFQSWWNSRPSHPPFPKASTNLSAMFHLDIGGGIGKYRQYLIEKLREHDMGEKIWEVVIEGTEEMEQHLSTDTEINYPRTLEKAKQVYGSRNINSH